MNWLKHTLLQVEPPPKNSVLICASGLCISPFVLFLPIQESVTYRF
jgi:hypothetical protein